MQTSLPFSEDLLLTRLEDSHVVETIRTPLARESTFSALDSEWNVRHKQHRHERLLTAQVVSGGVDNTAVGISWTDSEWSTENYVLIPGAVYNGNRFHSQPYGYSPPKVGPDPTGDDRTPWIGNLPRLSKEPGPSHLDQMSVDGATPGMGIYFPARRKALVILTEQKNAWGPFGFEIIENEDRDRAEIRLMSPGLRHDHYFTLQGGYALPSPDRGASLHAGDTLHLPFHLHWMECCSVQDLFEFVFEHRADCFETVPFRKEIPFSATWDILHEKHNRENWIEDLELYQVSISNDPPGPSMLFQSGWTGGMITPYAMIQEGDAESLDRSLRHIDMYLSGAMGDAGLFHEFYWERTWQSQLRSVWNEDGEVDILNPGRPWTLVRRMGDVLYFLTRTMLLLEQKGLEDHIRPEWKETLKRNAGSILKIWFQYGEFGQYVNVETGEIQIAGSTAGALIPAALILAFRWLGDPDWVSAAAAIGEHFRTRDLAEGVTTGGPGDAVQAPDSESVAALIESFILLHEETGDEKWLRAAQDAVVQTASWALSYDHEFPAGTALAEIGAQSRGVFLANAQNKTGVPGICTLSGQGILRVFRQTGDLRFLHLLQEVAHTIPQYMGREDKQIPCRLRWGRKGVDFLPPGWICERVNVTQWGEQLGEISGYSCWCEVAMMLTWCDIPGVYAQPDTGILCCLDHVEAEWAELGKIKVYNPTTFPARVRVMVETPEQARRPLDINFAASQPVIDIAPGQSVLLSSFSGTGPYQGKSAVES